MNIINLTPHALQIHGEGGVATIPPSGEVARVTTSSSTVSTVEVEGVTVKVNATAFGSVQGLPDPQEGVLYVTSLIVAQAAKRADVVSPGTLLRNEQGQPIGADGFAVHV